MLLPSISRPSRATRMRDSKRVARCTNFAAARACMPSWFTTVTLRDVIVPYALTFSPRSRSDATQIAFRPCSRISRATASRSCELRSDASLISIGRLTPVITSSAIGLEKRHAEVRRRAAEHVGQQQHAGVAAHPLDRLRDVLARVVDLVVPADRHGGELRQIADDHLGGVDQLGRELPVRDDDHANHAIQIRLRFVERSIAVASQSESESIESTLPMSRCRTRIACRECPRAPLQPLGDHHRAVPAAGAADRDRQIALAFGDVVRHDEPQVVLQPLDELARRSRRAP